ncbi:hypothetical protein EVAR_66844_1 [Eumeta japonica]|uniref:Uncharacterized protein n=1 Tax=Eumeta variegata TaxID=151549 RepID=A0A4C1Z7H2_EUMVA|nr:hypothetical protein EVAR_66844_1 [Eumeta japonica]
MINSSPDIKEEGIHTVDDKHMTELRRTPKRSRLGPRKEVAALSGALRRSGRGRLRAPFSNGIMQAGGARVSGDLEGLTADARAVNTEVRYTSPLLSCRNVRAYVFATVE